MNCLERIFGRQKPLIAMVHLPALPGRCGYNAGDGMARIIDAARRDLGALRASGAAETALLLEVIHPFEFDEAAVIDELAESVRYWREALAVDAAAEG